MPRRLSWWLGGPAAVVCLVACGADDVESTTAASEPSSYCTDLAALIGVLDDGGTIADYNARLSRVVAESPAGHSPTWSLLLELSEEPFSYDNFNPAVDSLDRLGPDLDATCPGLDQMIVDDAGRLRSYPSG